MLALYVGPYMFVSVWLVLYTWLQHTDADVPHLEASEWSYIKGAFLTIDRPYGAVFDFLHHRIGSTHVAHHVECAIPATRRSRRRRRSRRSTRTSTCTIPPIATARVASSASPSGLAAR